MVDADLACFLLRALLNPGECWKTSTVGGNQCESSFAPATIALRC